MKEKPEDIELELQHSDTSPLLLKEGNLYWDGRRHPLGDVYWHAFR